MIARIRLLFLLCLTACMTAEAARIIEIAPRGVARGSRVLLRDVVRQPERLPAGWGERDVADAPAPRETRDLSLSEIATALHPYEDMRNVVLRGRATVTMTSDSQALDVERIERALRAFLESSEDDRERRFKISDGAMDWPRLPAGDLTAEVLSLRESARNDGADRTQAIVDLLVDGRSVVDSPLEIDLIELRPFWAARRPLTRGTALTSDDLKTVWLAPRNAARYYSVDQQIAGMELRRSVATGQRLSPAMLDTPIAVRRGETLRVVAGNGGLTVTMRARALSDGRLDERIACLNESSGQRMQVRLVGTREAVLEHHREPRS